MTCAAWGVNRHPWVLRVSLSFASFPLKHAPADVKRAETILEALELHSHNKGDGWRARGTVCYPQMSSITTLT